jgi:pyridinium-3,5-biscarboxylic acid mononucleotide sulfurtransferase
MKNMVIKNQINKNLKHKLDKLINILKVMESVVVGFSGGVDSTFLIKIAHEVLGNNVLAVTINSPLIMKTELKESKKNAKLIGIRHVVIEEKTILNQFAFKENPPDRCYHCKKSEFGEILKIAKKNDIKEVADGSNIDDLSDYRPGRKALIDLNIRSPLIEAGLGKLEIRELSKIYNLPTWDKPAMACLASRIPYRTRITNENLRRVEKAENLLKTLGFKQVRVRDFDDTARIEIENDISFFSDLELRNKIIDNFHKIGYKFITVDLEGYTKGSLNKGLIINK